VRAHPDFDRALRSARRVKRIVVVETFRLDGQGRPRTTRRLYPATHALPRPPKVTGTELFLARMKAGLTQGDLARVIGVSQSAVSIWERRGDGPIPSHRPTQIEEAIALMPRGPNSDERVRGRIAEAVRESPGIARWRLFDQAGHSKSAKNALRTMLREGELVEGEARDSVGRPYLGIYLAAAVPSPSARIAGREIRHRRRELGISSRVLGELVGVRANTITRWETEKRDCPPARLVAIREALQIP
jgi:DNA-binding transcriptional regulator YiaG